jgi:hypothetical protein
LGCPGSDDLIDPGDEVNHPPKPDIGTGLAAIPAFGVFFASCIAEYRRGVWDFPEWEYVLKRSPRLSSCSFWSTIRTIPYEQSLCACPGDLRGGAVGNLIDRFTQGYVLDFIAVATFRSSMSRILA